MASTLTPKDPVSVHVRNYEYTSSVCVGQTNAAQFTIQMRKESANDPKLGTVCTQDNMRNTFIWQTEGRGAGGGVGAGCDQCPHSCES